LGNGWLATPRSSVKVIGLLSSTAAAQADSIIDSNTIAANFAGRLKRTLPLPFAPSLRPPGSEMEFATRLSPHFRCR
jgi:hypothetical protein